MPKSRFNPQRHRARHNPLAGSKKSSGQDGGDDKRAAAATSAKTAMLPPSSTSATSDAGILQLLSKLPLPGTTLSPAPTQSDIHWALSSVSLLSSHPSSLTQLLQARHSLLPRLVRALEEHDDVEVREQASGAIRNICVEAGDAARGKLVANGALDACLRELARTTRLFGIGVKQGDSTAQAPANGETATPAAQAPPKPFEEMNRKERRHAAKAAAKAAAKGDTNGSSNGAAPASSGPTSIQATAVATAAEVATQTLSHLINLLSTLWCLVESSSASTLSSSALGTHSSSLLRLCTSVLARGVASSSQPPTSSTAHVEGGSPDAWIEAATEASQVLLTLSESNVDVCATLVGLSRREVDIARLEMERSSRRGGPGGKGKNKQLRQQTSLAEDDDEDIVTRAAGTENLIALEGAVSCLEAELSKQGGAHGVGAAPEVERRVIGIHKMGLLSLGILRNVAAALPKEVQERYSIGVPEQGGAKTPLGRFEESRGIAVLLGAVGYVRGEQGGNVRTLLGRIEEAKGVKDVKSEGGMDTDGDAAETESLERSPSSRRAEEWIGCMQLALEILAEVSTVLGGEGVDGGEDDDEDGMDAEDLDMDGLVAETEGDEGMDEGADDDEHTGAAQPRLSGPLASSTLARLVSDVELVGGLLQLASPIAEIEAAFPATHAKDSAATTTTTEALPTTRASLSRTLALRSLSALSNLLFSIATHAPPPPSSPIHDADTEGQARVAAFKAWVSSGRTLTAMKAAWSSAFELASALASLPVLAEGSTTTAGAGAAALEEETHEGRSLLELCVGILWAVSRSFEAQSETTVKKALPLEAAEFDAAMYPRSGNGPGVINALCAAAYRAKPSSASSGASRVEGGQEEEANSALGQGTLGTQDALRVKCLGTLGCIARLSGLTVERNASLASFFCEALEALPSVSTSTAPPAGGASNRFDAPTTAEGMVVVLNNIFDTFADENAPYDVVGFRKNGVLQRLRRVSTGVRSTARSVDKRKQASLRASADEAFSNLLAFVEYRSSIV